MVQGRVFGRPKCVLYREKTVSDHRKTHAHTQFTFTVSSLECNSSGGFWHVSLTSTENRMYCCLCPKPINYTSAPEQTVV